MIILRAIAVGFGSSAFFMYMLYVPFQRWVLSSPISGHGKLLHERVFNLTFVSETLASFAGTKSLYFTMFVLCCLALGFLFASFYAFIEQSVREFVRYCFSRWSDSRQERTTKAFSNAIRN